MVLLVVGLVALTVTQIQAEQELLTKASQAETLFQVVLTRATVKAQVAAVQAQEEPTKSITLPLVMVEQVRLLQLLARQLAMQAAAAAAKKAVSQLAVQVAQVVAATAVQLDRAVQMELPILAAVVVVLELLATVATVPQAL
jgi:hypothetical protein